ncbi:MAG: transcription elongation factor GreA [Christensenellales bacterium]|jgi:transcription elongation factor GreA
MEKISQKKYDELVARLNYLETVASAEVAEAIRKAKEFGDLSENAEYAAAKEAQIQIYREISTLEAKLSGVEVIDESTISIKKVGLGTVVKVQYADSGEEEEYKIVSSLEANSRENKISEKSPIGSALMGAKKGDEVEVSTPRGVIRLKVLKISK